MNVIEYRGRESNNNRKNYKIGKQNKKITISPCRGKLSKTVIVPTKTVSINIIHYTPVLVKNLIKKEFLLCKIQ